MLLSVACGGAAGPPEAVATIAEVFDAGSEPLFLFSGGIEVSVMWPGAATEDNQEERGACVSMHTIGMHYSLKVAAGLRRAQ